MMQGDQYSLKIKGTGFDIGDVEKIEFTVGNLSKTYPGQVVYDPSSEEFLFPLTQRETFGMCGRQPAEARIKFSSGNIQGAVIDPIDVIESISGKEID
ncbi:MAG: hypothetical protein J5874_02160 [Oscillospiraceae bacterium]|nr:hypothetical protein [Oscillospiraceae bacterium]